MRQVQEPVLIQTFIAQPPVERLDVGILVRCTRLNQAKRHVTGLRPGQHGASAELLAIVSAYHVRQTAGVCKPAENPRERVSADGSFRHDRDRFVRGVIDDRQTLDHPPIGAAVEYAVHWTRGRSRRRDVSAADEHSSVPACVSVGVRANPLRYKAARHVCG